MTSTWSHYNTREKKREGGRGGRDTPGWKKTKTDGQRKRENTHTFTTRIDRGVKRIVI